MPYPLFYEKKSPCSSTTSLKPPPFVKLEMLFKTSQPQPHQETFQTKYSRSLKVFQLCNRLTGTEKVIRTQELHAIQNTVALNTKYIQMF